VRKAIAKGTLTEEGEWVAESLHLLQEAARGSLQITTVIAAENMSDAVEKVLPQANSTKVALLPERVFESVAGTKTSQGVIALVKPRLWPIDKMFTANSLVLVLDCVQDPGNCGTLVRAAEAFGATGVLFVKGAASPYHPKTLRASAGSLFRIPYVASVEPSIARAALEHHRLAVYAGLPRADVQPLDRADFRIPCALVIGNEGRGVGQEFRSGAISLTIPTVHVESLNASIAGAIFLYEAHRQRAAEVSQ